MDAARPSDRTVLLVAILASFVSFLDGTVVTVALPAIERDVGGGLATQQWVVDAYLVTLGAFILVAGSLSDAFGRIRILRIGLLIFGVSSIAIALAPDPLTLILLRAVQGVGGALLVPSSLALITSHFAGAARSRAIGTWTGATTVATLVGPVVGGLFVDLLSWRWVFVLNVLPIALTLVLLVRGGLRDARVPGARIDIPGAALCTIGLGALVFALIEQPRLGWDSPAVWIAGIGGILGVVGFVLRQRVAPSPLMPLSLFSARNFWAGNLSTFFVYAALSLNGLVVAVYLQQGAGLSATLAGLATLPPTVLMILFSSRVGALAGKLGPRLFMTAGPALMAVGALLLLTVAEDFDYLTQVLPGLLAFGAGLTLTVAPLTSAVLSAVPAERSGIASAVNNAVARVAGLVSVALLGVVVAGDLDLEGFHRAAIVTAALMAAGAVASFAGIRDPRR
ncbi:MFS transporter [Microbacterium caowuchunii]|uniref:MFS transporter n=1 Tax=Microbacterium caowuchunii TaxID=2614638 RepID=UPI001CD74431|nr:MFS transporter [Microbacterium caowuchunii]